MYFGVDIWLYKQEKSENIQIQLFCAFSTYISLTGCVNIDAQTCANRQCVCVGGCCQRPLTQFLSLSRFTSRSLHPPPSLPPSLPLSLSVFLPTPLSFHQVLTTHTAASERLISSTRARGSERGRIEVTGEQQQHHWQASPSLGERGRKRRSGKSEEKRAEKEQNSEGNKFLVGGRISEGEFGVRERGGWQWGDWELLFSLFYHRLWAPPASSLLLLPSSSFSFSSSSLLLFSSWLSPQLPPWGLSSPSPSPPPSLPTSPGPSWEPPGCCAAGGCLAGSLRHRPRHLHLRSCWVCGEESWSVMIVRSAQSHCLTPRGRSSRTRGGMCTRTVRMWGWLCSSGEFCQKVKAEHVVLFNSQICFSVCKLWDKRGVKTLCTDQDALV